MIIRNYIYGRFEANPFVIGTTNRNEYFPVYAIFENQAFNYSENKLSEHLINDIFLYKKPQNNTYTKVGIRRYDDLFTVLKDSGKINVYTFVYNEVNYYLNCLKGYIADENDNILLILTTNSFNIFKEYTGDLKTDNLKLYVSNELIINEKYKNLFKKINSEYIQYCYNNNIEVVFTNSEKIQKTVYSNDFNVEFNNLEELNNHLKSGIGENLFYDYVSPITEVQYEELPY
jgi:hypothetical protein